MYVEKIEYQEKTSNFLITLDNQESFQISYEVYEELKIVRGLEIFEKQYNELTQIDEYIRAKAIALRFINYKTRSEYEVAKKLRQSSISENAIKSITNYLKGISLINDKAYAKEYIRQCLENKNYSLNKTKLKMYEKGLDKVLVEEILLDYDTDEIEIQNALTLAEKKSKNMDLLDIKHFMKAYRYLVSNGFSFNVAKNVLNRLKNDKK